jgi:hypothetical protein
MAATVPIAAAASIDQRFAQLIQQFGLTKNSFAISLGKTASVVQHLIDGRNKPGFDLMCKVFEVYPNVSRDWLLLGRGPMLVGSNGVSGPALAAAHAATSEPDFEPIDLADVAPRAVRRPTTSRLQEEEIAATLALATAAANGTSASSAPAPIVAAGGPTENSGSQNRTPAPAPAAPEVAATRPEPEMPPAQSGMVQRPTRRFQPFAAPAVGVLTEAAEPATSAASVSQTFPAAEASKPVAVAEPVVEAAGAVVSAPAPAVPAPINPEAYVAAAIHAQHLQHQLALAELRNQHLLEQQQMLREMLAMARQSMV